MGAYPFSYLTVVTIISVHLTDCIGEDGINKIIWERRLDGKYSGNGQGKASHSNIMHFHVVRGKNIHKSKKNGCMWKHGLNVSGAVGDFFQQWTADTAFSVPQHVLPALRRSCGVWPMWQLPHLFHRVNCFHGVFWGVACQASAEMHPSCQHPACPSLLCIFWLLAGEPKGSWALVQVCFSFFNKASGLEWVLTGTWASDAPSLLLFSCWTTANYFLWASSREIAGVRLHMAAQIRQNRKHVDEI